MKIFCNQTHDFNYSTKSKEWSYWFDKNPYGKGLYSIARDGEKIIGFCALIPVEIVVNKSVIKDTKVEFLFVLPDYRKTIAGNLKQTVSVTLLRALYKTHAVTILIWFSEEQQKPQQKLILSQEKTYEHRAYVLFYFF